MLGTNETATAQVEMSQALRNWTADNAHRLRSHDMAVREALPQLATESLIDLGVPMNKLYKMQQASTPSCTRKFKCAVGS